MSFEAISSITQAEEAAKQTVADAEVKARQMIANAQTEGEASVKAAAEKASSERTELFDKAQGTISANAEEIKKSSDEAVASLRHKAMANIDEAAKLIAERIVKG